jgi:hypothetical protein
MSEPHYSVNATTAFFHLGTAIDMPITSVALFIFLIELFLLLFVVYGKQSHLLLCCYKIGKEDKNVKERLWNHLLLLGTVVFCCYQIAAITIILVKVYYVQVWLNDLSLVVVTLMLYDIHFALFLIILCNVAKTTTMGPYKEILYKITVCFISVLSFISFIMCLFGVIICNVSGVYLRDLAIYAYLPVMALEKIILLLLFGIIGGRIIYAICTTNSISNEVKSVAYRILFGMVIIVISTIGVFVGVSLVFIFLDDRVMIGLYICLTVPEILFFLVMIVLFWPMDWIHKVTRKNVEIVRE